LAATGITDECLRALTGSSLLKGLHWLALPDCRVPSRDAWLALANAMPPGTRLVVWKRMDEALRQELRGVLGARLIVG
jgi:hypothetical protein